MFESNINKIRTFIIFSLLGIISFLISSSPAYAADVVAPSKDNVYTLTVTNIGSQNMAGVNVAASVIQNPGGLITITNVAPQNATIAAGGSQAFQIKFDAACGNLSGVETGKFKFTITKSTPGPLYVKNCGIDPATCSELEGEFTLETEKNKPTITISGAANGATYYLPVSLTISYSVTDDKDPNPTVNANYPSGTVFDSEGSYSVVVTGKDCAGNQDTKSLSFRIAQRPRPDDTYSISDGKPTSIASDPFAKVAVLNRGFVGSLASILSGLKETYAVINLPLDLETLSQYPLLIIPSDGLSGLDKSQSFKDALRQYAENGGVILSFTQERGYMLETLPGGWQGVGYLEENGCQTYAGGIENQHVLFSGQDSVYIDANVDGYFTTWPKEAKVLVRRTKNAMPFLLSYPIGQGIVLASTLYSDYGYISGQINLDEKRLIRDTISWAKDIKTSINSYVTGTVKETVQIQNKANVDADSVTYTFYDPDKKLVNMIDEAIAEPLAPGQYGQGNLAYKLPAGSPIGIYWIKYQLKDAAGNIVQPEEPTSRFAVQYNIGTVNISKDLNVLVKTTQPFYPIGSTGTFDIVVANAKTSEVPVRLKYGTSYHEPLYSAVSKTFEDKIIPASGSTTFTVDVAKLARGDYFSVGLFDQSDRLLAFGQEKFYVFYPFVKPVVSVDKNKYLPEENGTLSYTLSYNFLSYINKTSYEVTANIRILDQSGAKVSETSKTLVLTGTGFAEQLPFTAPAKGGRYIVQVEMMSFNRQIGVASSYFEVLTGDFVTIAPHYPATWSLAGGNPVSFDLKNVSLSTLPTGSVKATLFDPDNAVAWTEVKQFQDLAAGSTETLSFAVAVPNAKFGTYRLKYELTYMENAYEYFADFPNQMVFDLGFDKLSYKMRENMLLDLRITNTGLFQGDISVSMEIPTFGHAETRTVSVAGNAAVPYTIPVPTTISPGTHELKVKLLLANQLAKTYQFAVPASRLNLAIGKNSYTSGETGTITVANTGGVDTNYSINIKLLDVNGNLVHEANDASTVEASSSKTASFTVPASSISGNYLVQAECRNVLKGNEATVLSELVSVSGVTGSLEVKTDKKTYLSSDIKNILSTLVNTSDKDINNATLRLRIYGQSDCKQPAAPAGGGVGGGGEGEGPYIYPIVPDQFICTNTNAYSFNLRPYENSRGGQQITPKALLILDADSWNTRYQNQAVLNNLNIPYTQISSGQLSLTDLYQYTHILVPSDQPQSMYNNLDINMTAITAWIQAGGSFQFNACDVGWAGGHWTYGPDQLRHVYPVYVQQNYIRDTDHPVLQGMTNSNFYGWNYVSHGYFTNVPANARILLSANSDGSRPTLVDYTLGNGHVVASQNTLEWTNAGMNCPNCNLDILDNITKYMFRIGFDNLKWNASDVDASLMNISIDPTTDMMSITPATGVYGADQVLLTLRDQAGLTATQWINVAVSPTMPDGNLLWEKEIPVAALGTLDLTTEFDISQYKLTGKFYVEGTLISDIKQEIAKDIDSFYIIDSDLGVTMETDKRVYKPGETVTVTTSVTNNTAVGETGLTLVLAKDGVTFQSVTFNLAAGETRTFTGTISGSATFLLEAKVKDVRILDHVRVETPQVVMTVTGPDVAGLENFELSTKLENKGTTPAAVQLNFAEQTHSVTLQPGQSETYEQTLHISNTTSYYITLSGDVSQSITKTVTYGALANFALSPKTVYAEGSAEVPYVITNTGSVDLAFTAEFTLSNADTGGIVETATQSFNLLVSGSVSDTLVFGNLTEGRYRLSYTSPFGSGSVTVVVSTYNRVAIESATIGTSLTADGKLPVTAQVRNTGANSFAGNLLFDTGFYTETRALQLAVGASASVTVNVPLTVSAGNYEALIRALYNYVPVGEMVKQFSLASLFAVTQMPSDPVFRPGDTGVITLGVRNQGLVGGMVSVAVKGDDLIDVAQADRLSAGEQKSFTFRFPIAEDITANWYQAVITLANLDTGATQDIPLSYYVQGYDIGVTVKTDKPCYPEGDTARVTLLVNNNAERGLDAEGAAAFNDFSEKQNFMVGGKPVTDMIDTSTSSGDVTLAKVTAYSDSDMGVFDSNHITLTGGGTATYSYAWCYDQNGDIWTYGWSSGPLSKYNGKTGAWMKNVSIPYSGHLQIAVDKDGRMYGGYYYGTTVVVFNPETGAAIAEHATPNYGYVAGVFWDGEYLWFGERLWSGNKYYRVDVSGGGWKIVNTFTSNFGSEGYGMAVVGNRLLISNSTQDSFLYHWDLDFTNNTMSSTYRTTPYQSSDYFTGFNYNGKFLERKGYYSSVIRNYKAYRKAYAASGTLLSAVQDAGWSENATVSWDSTQAPGTSVKVETRTGNVLDPDGTWSAWQEQANENVITSPASRFLQYRVTLDTTDDTVSPILRSLSVDLPQQNRQIVHTTQEDFEKMPVSLEYAVPVHFTGQKLFYGIYSKSGWGIHLNSQYFCEANGDMLLYTDKQVYSSGETVTIHVYPYKTGTLKVSALGYENTFVLNDTSPFDITFTLPAEMATGSYSIRADFLGNTLIYNYDVKGYTVIVHERSLDKAEYLPGDRMVASVTVDSNQAISGVTIAAWIYSGEQTYTYTEMTGLSLASGTNVLELTGLMQSHTWGFAETTIALFKAVGGDPYGMFLTADSIGFDVPDKNAPISRITVGDPKFVMDGRTAVSGVTMFALTGDDAGSVVSGVARLEYRLSAAGSWQRYAAPFNLSGLPEGDAVIRYRSIDKAGNSEPEQSLAVVIDGTPPVTTLTTGEPKFVSADGTVYVTGATPVTLQSTDNLSGVALAEYRIDGGPWMPYAPVELGAEGVHRIEYYSQDGLGNKETVRTAVLVVDNTPPVVTLTASEVLVPGVVNTVSPATLFTVNAEDLQSGIKTVQYNIDGGPWQPAAGSFNLAGMSAGQHTIAYTAADRVRNEAATQSFTARMVVINIAKEVSLDPRVLILARHADNMTVGVEERKAAAIAIQNLEKLLAGRGIPYSIARDTAMVRESIRSGRFNTYLFLDYKKEHLEEELKEAAFYGDGVVSIKTRPNADPELDPVLNVKFYGSSKENSLSVTMVPSPVSDAGTILFGGERIVVLAQALSPATQIIGYRENANGLQPLILFNRYGRGKALVFGFDLLNCPDQAKAGELLVNAINYVKPENYFVRASGSLPVGIGISNSTEPVNVKITETIPRDSTADSIVPQAALMENTIVWQASLQAGEKTRYGYYLDLPDLAGEYTVKTELSYDNNGMFIPYGKQSLTFTVQASGDNLVETIFADLQRLASAGKDDAGRIADVSRNLSRVRSNEFTAKGAEENIKWILFAIEDLMKISVDTKELRLKLDELLKVWEKKWYLANSAG